MKKIPLILLCSAAAGVLLTGCGAHSNTRKMLYLAMKDITKKWTGRRQDWSRIYAQLVIYYGDRIPE